MSEMIERAAKAMAALRYATPWDELMSHQRDQFCGMARVAIEAMPPKPINMQDIRLVAGEGKLDAHTVLIAVNIILRQRASSPLSSKDAP